MKCKKTTGTTQSIMNAEDTEIDVYLKIYVNY